MRSGILVVAAVAAAWGPIDARAQDGEALYRRQCATCHATQAGQNKIGPTMAGIAGSKSAGVPGFEFSDAMKGANLTWTDDTLAKYIADPKGTVPGTKMVYAGMKNPDDVKAVVDYLKTLK
ncbi:MAG: c-type cytochrome [Proteobacteria bacterium]|nr:c-type cytochrome [Pseudomonadota bacterium]